jgi:hypothetical protein
VLPAWYDIDDLEGICRLHLELTTMPGESKLARQTPYYPAATATLMRSLPVGKLASSSETDPQISIASA